VATCYQQLWVVHGKSQGMLLLDGMAQLLPSNLRLRARLLAQECSWIRMSRMCLLTGPES
jgi:hypothetical protein